jgi:hypothetical protein
VPALGVYAVSATAIKCVAPAWGELYPYSGASSSGSVYTTPSVYTTLAVINTDVQKPTTFASTTLAKFEFEEVRTQSVLTTYVK